MVCLGRDVRSWAIYILEIDHRLFRSMSILYPRHNSYHYIILGFLRSTTLRKHTKYLMQCTRIPLWTITTPMEGNPEASGSGSKEEHLYLRGHVEACQNDSLRALRYCVGPFPHPAPQPQDQCKPKGRSVAEDGGGARVDRGDPGHRHPPPQGSIAPNEFVLQGHSTARCLLI